MGCLQPKIKLAYHTLCQSCAGNGGKPLAMGPGGKLLKPKAGVKAVCAKCAKTKEEVDEDDLELKEIEKDINELEGSKGQIPGIQERERRSMLRELYRRRHVLMKGGDEEEEEPQQGDDDEVDGNGEGAAGGDGAATGADAGADSDDDDEDAEDDEDEDDEDDEEDDEADDDDNSDSDSEEEQIGDVIKRRVAQHLAAGSSKNPRRRTPGSGPAGTSSGADKGPVVISAPASLLPLSAAAAAAGAASAGGKATNVNSVGTKSMVDPYEAGLVDASIFTRALAEAERRKAAAAGGAGAS